MDPTSMRSSCLRGEQMSSDRMGALCYRFIRLGQDMHTLKLVNPQL